MLRPVLYAFSWTIRPPVKAGANKERDWLSSLLCNTMNGSETVQDETFQGKRLSSEWTAPVNPFTVVQPLTKQPATGLDFSLSDGSLDWIILLRSRCQC